MGGHGTGGKEGGGEWICRIKYGQSGSGFSGGEGGRGISDMIIYIPEEGKGFFIIFLFKVPRSSLRDYSFTAGFNNQYSLSAPIKNCAHAGSSDSFYAVHLKANSCDLGLSIY